MHSLFKSLLILALFAPILGACGESTGPDSYPVTMRPTSVENKSAIRAFVREGGAWKEITGDNPDILSDPYIAESVMIQTDEDASIKLVSSTEWRAEEAPTEPFTYTYSDKKFHFAYPFGFQVYATGDYTEFKQHMVAGVSKGSISGSARVSYAPPGNPIDVLISPSILFPLSSEEGDTIAYQTFDIVYKAE